MATEVARTTDRGERLAPLEDLEGEHHLRRDAAENRRRLLDSAGRVFADQGLDASVEEIARAAGVGMGTLYRRFPTKEALIQELVDELINEAVTAAEGALDLGGGRGLEAFLLEVCELQATRRGLHLRLWCDERGPKRDRARELLGRLLAQAKAAGVIREDVTAPDISLLLLTLGLVIERTEPSVPGVWRRVLEIVIAGMRPSRGALRSAAPSLEDVARIVARSTH